MTSPFASVGLARRNYPDGPTAHRVDNDEQSAADPAIQAIAGLAVLPSLVNLDPPVRISKSCNHESERKPSIAQALIALGIIPFKFHYILSLHSSMNESFNGRDSASKKRPGRFVPGPQAWEEEG